MTKGRRNFFLVLLIAFTIATFFLITRIISGRYTVAKAEGLCPYIRITDADTEMLAELRAHPVLAASFEENAEVDAFIPMEFDLGYELAGAYLPDGAELSDFSTYSRTVLIGYRYDGYRIMLTCDPRAVIEKTVSPIPPEGEEISVVYVNNANKNVRVHEM